MCGLTFVMTAMFVVLMLERLARNVHSIVFHILSDVVYKTPEEVQGDIAIDLVKMGMIQTPPPDIREIRDALDELEEAGMIEKKLRYVDRTPGDYEYRRKTNKGRKTKKFLWSNGLPLPV